MFMFCQPGQEFINCSHMALISDFVDQIEVAFPR
jgi:hypothetical protein